MKEAVLSGKSITKSSGSGKSTLLYALSGMDRPNSGHVIYQEQDIANASEKELTAGLISNLSDKETKRLTDDLIRRMKPEILFSDEPTGALNKANVTD